MIKYEVVGILTHGGKEAGLLLATAMGGATAQFSYDEIREKIINGAIQVSGTTMINNKVVVENRDILKSFPIDKKENKETGKDSNSNIFNTEDGLLDVIEDVKGYRKRYLFNRLVKWVDKGREPMVAALYGLRRTGKTVLLLQICEHYIKLGKKVAYAALTVDTDNDKFVKELARLVDEKYDIVVVDEITYLDGLLKWGNRLSDIYARKGVKIIMAGTQSLMLEAARYEILFDRIRMFNTTYISYQEFESLYSGATVLDYIKWGGVLSKSRIVKDKPLVGDTSTDEGINTEEPLDNYVNTAIIDNIEHTLESYSRANSRWRRVFEEHRAENLEGIIQLYVMECSKKALMDDTGKEFMDKNLGSTFNMLQRKKIKLNPEIKSMVSNYTREALNIPTNLGLDEDLVEDLNNLLKQLDLLEDAIEYTGKELKKHTFPIFIQPGLQYDQVMQAVNALTNNKKEEEKGIEAVEGEAELVEAVEGEAELLREKMMADIEGKLLEAVIRLNLIKLVKSKKNGKSIGVFSINPGNKEIDIVVRQGRDNITLIEVKRSEKIIPQQYKWLCDKEFNSVIEERVGKVRRRIVIYMGESQIHKADGYEILYINATDWLLTTDITKEMMK